MSHYSIINTAESSISPNGLLLRQLLREQLNEELALFYQPSLLNHHSTSDDTIDRLIQYWLETENIALFIAVKRETYLGFVAAQLRPDIYNDVDVVTGEIVAVYVATTFRKQGLATALLKEAELWMVENKAHAINVSWLKGNVASERLYKNFGFQDVHASARKIITPQQ